MKHYEIFGKWVERLDNIELNSKQLTIPAWEPRYANFSLITQIILLIRQLTGNLIILILKTVVKIPELGRILSKKNILSSPETSTDVILILVNFSSSNDWHFVCPLQSNAQIIFTGENIKEKVCKLNLN